MRKSNQSNLESYPHAWIFRQPEKVGFHSELKMRSYLLIHYFELGYQTTKTLFTLSLHRIFDEEL